jgi:hypothetical protein
VHSIASKLQIDKHDPIHLEHPAQDMAFRIKVSMDIANCLDCFGGKGQINGIPPPSGNRRVKNGEPGRLGLESSLFWVTSGYPGNKNTLPGAKQKYAGGGKA